MQEEMITYSGRCDGEGNAKRTSSISTDQGEAETPQEEGDHYVRTASKINIMVLPQVFITALRPD
jgi:hypothetical protein